MTTAVAQQYDFENLEGFCEASHNPRAENKYTFDWMKIEFVKQVALGSIIGVFKLLKKDLYFACMIEGSSDLMRESRHKLLKELQENDVTCQRLEQLDLLHFLD